MPFILYSSPEVLFLSLSPCHGPSHLSLNPLIGKYMLKGKPKTLQSYQLLLIHEFGYPHSDLPNLFCVTNSWRNSLSFPSPSFVLELVSKSSAWRSSGCHGCFGEFLKGGWSKELDRQGRWIGNKVEGSV